MHRIYQKFIGKVSEIITLEKEPAHHLTNVLRAIKGEQFVLFNGEGGEYEAEIIFQEKSLVKVQLQKYRDIDRESPLFIHLAQGIARGEKMDFIIQKAVELGVNKITPLLTEFCNVKLATDRVEKKLQHWRQVIISACEQCGRTRLPEISHPMPFLTWLPQCHESLKLLLQPQGSQNFSDVTETPQSICLIIGSEGGLSESEIKTAITYHFKPLQLGPRILRTETAGLAAITLIQQQWGDLR